MADLVYAIIQDGKVINTVSAPSGWVSPDVGTTSVAVAPGEGLIGSSYDGTTFTPAPIPSAPALTTSQLLSLAGSKQDNVLAQVWTFDVGTADAPVLTTTKLDARGQASLNILATWCLLNASNASATQAYSNVDFTPLTLSLAQATSLVTQAGAVVSQSYSVLNQLSASITASPPTLTTLDQIQSAGWPKP